jgi:uncharacterized protein involved in type VI secretion and phage assembly
MTLTLFESIQRIVHDELARVRSAEIGTVDKQHPHAGESDDDNYECTVVLRNSGIVLPRVPVATQRIGSASIPGVGELVLVQFVNGDLNAPVIVGRLYNEEDRPPPNSNGQSVLHVPLGGSDDESVHVEIVSGDERAIVVRLGAAMTAELRDDDPVVQVDVGGKASVAIARDGGLEVESASSLKLKGSEVSIEAQGQLTLKGATVNIN